VAFAGPNVRCAPYASFGTPELAKNAYEYMEDRNAVLLANHGLVAGGSTILKAFQVAEEIEFCAEVYVKARSIGKPVLLSEEEMAYMAERFKDYGQKEKDE
jgi:L-fuculose-phosphate aldolase